MIELSMHGLTEREVADSRKTHGSNRLTQKKRRGFFAQFLANFGDPIIKVLLAVLAVNLLFLFRNHDWYESIGIGIAVFLATFVSTLSEYGSESAFEKLQEESCDVQCRVKRNGCFKTVPAEDLVVGDLVFLQSGERIPADGVLIHGGITVDQSSLNGESYEVRKSATSNTAITLSPENVHAVLCGSVVCSGEGVMQISAVGDNTVYGTVAGEIQEDTRESPLKIRLGKLANTLSRLGFCAAGLVALADLFHSIVMENHYELSAVLTTLSTPQELFIRLLHAATLALTVVVVAVPEGLPMMITVVLSSNMRRLLKNHVLVRKLVGIETSGSLNILFTDKTGTLTAGHLAVSAIADAEGHLYHSVDEVCGQKRLWELLQLNCIYNTESFISEQTVVGGNATDRALLRYVQNSRRPLRTDCTAVSNIPFHSDRKWSGTEVKSSSSYFSLYKGAPERVFSMCNRYLATNGEICTLNDTRYLSVLLSTLEQQSMRMLAVAVSDTSLCESPNNLILVGILALRDELRSDVRSSIRTVQKAGVQVVMITGDSAQTATAIARSAGLLGTSDASAAVITGQQLAELNDEEVKQRLPHLRVVARALPTDKSRLVRLAQECNMVAGMTGDGVNDAPALKRADVGFAMGNGTEVAKQAGDIVILNNNFSSIVSAILFGRTIFKSIRKFIVFQLTMNLCAVGISILGPLLGLETPVTVMQMLWINIIMDTLAGLAFAGEPPLPEYMDEPPKQRDEPILNRYMLNQIVCTGLFTVGLCVGFLKWEPLRYLFRYDTMPIYWMTAFFALFVFCGIFNCFNARTYRLNLLSHLHRNPTFVFILTIIAIVQLALIYYGGALFRTAGLYPTELVTVIALSALVIPADLMRKAVLRLFHRKGTI